MNGFLPAPEPGARERRTPPGELPPARRSRGRRARRAQRLAGLVVVGAFLLAAAAHYRHYFSPRERAGVASPELAALLAADSPFERVLWLASPHQNLGALDERVGDLELYLAELSRLTGVARPRLPRFGPFALPPAREIVMAWNGSGESFLGVARIEPGVAWLARLSGRIAGNPWLAGGRVDVVRKDVRGAVAGRAVDRRERRAAQGRPPVGSRSAGGPPGSGAARGDRAVEAAPRSSGRSPQGGSRSPAAPTASRCGRESCRKRCRRPPSGASPASPSG